MTAPAVADSDWAAVAKSTRTALAHLGYPIMSRCLPDEDPCGGSWAEHAAAHLATIQAVADHQLGHLQPPGELVEAVYRPVAAELERRDGHT